jgi:fibro-slime domain-containing protein
MLCACAGLVAASNIGNTASSGTTKTTYNNGTYSVDVPSYSSDDPFITLPDTLTLQGTARDFREWSETGGHPDFEAKPKDSFGHYVNMVADHLDSEGYPTFRSFGNKVSSQAKDKNGNPIIGGNKSYIDSWSGDSSRSVSGNEVTVAGTALQDVDDFTGTYKKGALFSASSFNMWFRDTPGMNIASSFPTTLVRKPGTDLYVFDDKDVSYFDSKGGFFILDNKGFGNSKGESKNFHYTYHLETEFLYKKGAGQQFTFIGDDDVWVFVDGQLVIDLGGVHSAVTQTIDMDRINTLEHGKFYKLDFFFAERHRTQSNFRIETNLMLKRTVNLPAASNLFD